jgi:hypothetical protein
MFTEDGHPTLKVDDLGDAEKLLQNKRHFLDGARRLIQHDIIPVESGWNGWLGRYQSALVHAAAEIYKDRDRKVEIEVDHGSRGRR